MASVSVTLAAAEQVRNGGNAFIAKGNFARSEIISSSGTSAQGTLVAKKYETIAKVSSPDQAIAVTAGLSPTASLLNSIVIPAGGVDYISIEPGEIIAVVDI